MADSDRFPESAAATARGSPAPPAFGPGKLVAGTVPLVALAILATLAPPVGPGPVDPPPSPAVLNTANAAGQGYRLRVAGLHPLVSETPGESARVEIGAVLDPEGAWILEARLVSEGSGRVLWAGSYESAGTGPAAVRDAVDQALSDALRLTREGAGGDGTRL